MSLSGISDVVWLSRFLGLPEGQGEGGRGCDGVGVGVETSGFHQCWDLPHPVTPVPLST